MTDYQIQASTRRCAVTGKELQPGDRYFAVLIDQGDTFIRQDYSLAAWQGPPEKTFSYWQGRLPPTGTPRRPPIDDELLVDCLQRLEGELEPGKQAFRFVLALLLIRRKRLRLEDSSQDGGLEVMTLRCTKTGTRFTVIDPGLAEDELDSVQDEVFGILGWA